MASKQAVAAALAALSRVFSGVVDDEKVRLYHLALADLDDASLSRATALVIKQHRGEWVPVPAVLRDAAGANLSPAIDIVALLARISKAGSWSPNGWIYPSLTTVGVMFGPPIARAFSEAGTSDLYSESELTRSLALKKFTGAIAETPRRELDALQLPLIGDRTPPRRLGPGEPE